MASCKGEGVTISEGLISRVFVKDGRSGRSVFFGTIDMASVGGNAPNGDWVWEGWFEICDGKGVEEG